MEIDSKVYECATELGRRMADSMYDIVYTDLYGVHYPIKSVKGILHVAEGEGYDEVEIPYPPPKSYKYFRYVPISTYYNTEGSLMGKGITTEVIDFILWEVHSTPSVADPIGSPIMYAIYKEQDDAMKLAEEAALLFVKTNPDYYACDYNYRIMTDWMVDKNLPPILENFTYAFNILRCSNLLKRKEE